MGGEIATLVLVEVGKKVYNKCLSQKSLQERNMHEWIQVFACVAGSDGVRMR